MKLLFGLIGAALVLAFLAGIVLKVQEVALIVVVAVGLVLMAVDLWQARNEADS